MGTPWGHEQQPSRILGLHDVSTPLEPRALTQPDTTVSSFSGTGYLHGFEGRCMVTSQSFAQELAVLSLPIALQLSLFVVQSDLQNHQGSCLEVTGFM